MSLEHILEQKRQLQEGTAKIVTKGALLTLGGFVTEMAASHDLSRGFNAVDVTALIIGGGMALKGTTDVAAHILERLDLVEEEQAAAR